MFKLFNRFDICLWGGSCLLITLLFFCNPHRDILTLAASLIGATMLIFLAKGHPAGQILTIVFALVYAVISYRFRYYGEMITYLGMTAPTAALAAYEWIKHPFEKGKAEVKVAGMSKTKTAGLCIAAAIVTLIFYFVLKRLGTANLIVSTLSVTTSFFASALTVLRSHFYALGYAANDIVLICLWIMACIADISYLPMVLCFVIFLINDLYGYASWVKMKRRQSADSDLH